MTYRFHFIAADGRTYFLSGYKKVHDDPGQFDVVDDMTRLFTTVHSGEDEQTPIYGAGELRFNLRDGPALAASVSGDDSVMGCAFGFGFAPRSRSSLTTATPPGRRAAIINGVRMSVERALTSAPCAMSSSGR